MGRGPLLGRLRLGLYMLKDLVSIVVEVIIGHISL